MTAVVGLGAGGHARVVIEILRAAGGVEVVGLLDPRESLWQTEVLGVPVLGGDDVWPQLQRRGIRNVFIGLGAIRDMRPRQRLYERARFSGFDVVSAVHPSAIVSASARPGRGLTVMAGAIINANARLGENVIVNSGAIVEHDCVIGDHVHIATGAKLASTVEVRDGAHIGLGACVRQACRIGRYSVVGAGAVVVRDVPDNLVVVGVPAQPLRERTPAETDG